MKWLITALIINLTLNLYVFWKGWRVFKDKKFLRILHTAIFAIEFITYLICFLFHDHISYDIVHFIWIMGTTWMLFLFYAGAILVTFDIIWLLKKRAINRPKNLLSQPLKFLFKLYVTTVIFVALVLVYGFWNFNHPKVQQLELTVDKQTKNYDSLRIVFVSDMHLGYMFNKKKVRSFVELIMAQKPDIILMGGDNIDSSIKPLIRLHQEEEIKKLYAPLGIYSCMGNHEYRNEVEQKVKWLNDMGIHVIRDSSVLIDNAFYIVGREDSHAERVLPLTKIIQNQKIDKSKPIIVLKHVPNNLEEEEKGGADVALYGHTHHGQFFPINLVTDIIFEVAHGYKLKGKTHVYVSSGLGLAGPPYRICTVSEIAVINVKFGQK